VAGELVHFEIPADDTGKSLSFWSGLFGWQFQAFEGGPSEYHTAQFSDRGGVAITNMEPSKRGGRAYFLVDDINAGSAKVRELGGEASDAMPVPSMGWFSVCKDPHGNEFGLWQSDESAQMPQD
jgi:predicted enzyme related to lactoylglutathione lyase